MGKNKEITRIISGAESLALEKLDGKLTMSQVVQTFRWIGPYFEEFGLNKADRPTEKTNVTVREMISDGTFFQIFTGINPNLEASVMSINQIIEFCKKYQAWLRQEGLGTFFLTKKKRNPFQWLSDFILKRKLRKYFVIYVYVLANRPDAIVYRLECDDVRNGIYQHRVVSP